MEIQHRYEQQRDERREGEPANLGIAQRLPRRAAVHGERHQAPNGPHRFRTEPRVFSLRLPVAPLPQEPSHSCPTCQPAALKPWVDALSPHRSGGRGWEGQRGCRPALARELAPTGGFASVARMSGAWIHAVCSFPCSYPARPRNGNRQHPERPKQRVFVPMAPVVSRDDSRLPSSFLHVRMRERPYDRSVERCERLVRHLRSEVLRATGDCGQMPCRHLREDDERDRRPPGHYHEVRDREPERPRDFHCALGCADMM